MRKLLVGMATVGLLALSTASFAAIVAHSYVDFPIVVTVFTETLDIGGNSYNATALTFAPMTINDHILSQDKGTDANEPYIQITNEGSGTIRLAVSQAAATAPSGWTALLAGQAGEATAADSYRLSGVFTNFFGSLTAAQAAITGANEDDYEIITTASFGLEDRIDTAAGAWATDEKFAINGQTANAPVFGHLIAPAVPLYLGQRTLRMCLDAPSSLTTGIGLSQTIAVRVDAEVSSL